MRRRLDDEARQELDAHVDLLTERFVNSGMTPGEAYTAARRQLGNPTAVRQDIYDMNSSAWVEGVTQDARYAYRQLRSSPGFAAVVIATLALGIGGTTAVFSVVQAIVLAPLPYGEPGRLVRLYQQQPGNAESRLPLTGAHFTFLRDTTASFEDAAAWFTYSETGRDLVRGGRAERLRVLHVTSEYFRMLRSLPLHGYGFERSDETGTARVVLSHRVWRTHFAGDPSIVGTAVQLSGVPYEVAGIAPIDFEDPVVGAVDAWLPYNLAGNADDWMNHDLTAVGRLRSGISVEQARAEIAGLSQPMQERWPAVRLSEVVARPLHEDLVAPARYTLQMLLVAVGLVLLVACSNVANLALARATGRVQEFAVRAALGSSRRRLARQLLVESLLLAGLGGAFGLVIARIGMSALKRLGPETLLRLDGVGFDPVVLAVAAATTVATAVAFGVAPALRLGRIAPSQALRQQSRSATATRGQGRLRSGLAGAQLALALTLLMGAGVLLASFHRLQQVDLGFRTERVLTFDLSLPTVRYDAERRAIFHEELSRALAETPGVTAAGGISRLPATGSYHPWETIIRSGPRAGTSIGQAEGFNIQQRTVSGDIFGALEIPVLAGRVFDARDDASVSPRAVVSKNFARQAFPDLPVDSVVGQRISTVGREIEIIGVVGDVTLDVYGAPTLTVYHAHRQFSARNWALSQVVAAGSDPERLLDAVRAVVATLDPELVVHRAMPMTDVVGRGTGRERFVLVLMGAFALVSLMLAALGLYGVLAYSVRQRTQELGIRMALGATSAQVRGLVLRQGAVVLGAGLAGGVAGALSLGRLLSSLVFDVSPWDPVVLLSAVCLLTAVGVAAAWMPARRASRVEPGVAMQAGQ